MQATREGISAAGTFVEFAPGMQARENNFNRRYFLFRVQADGNTTPIVLDANTTISIEYHIDMFAVAAECFIRSVIDNFLNDMEWILGTGVHARPLFDRLKAFEDTNG